eukprot:767336-Hanusia_phi.AAC.8
MVHDEKKKKKPKTAKDEGKKSSVVEESSGQEDKQDPAVVKSVSKVVPSRASKFKNSLALQAIEDEDSDGATPSPPSSLDGGDQNEDDDDFDIEMMKESDLNDKISGEELKEVHEYAKYLGMDPIKDKKLLWIAVEAMTAKLPEKWKEYYTNDGQSYFYNESQKKTQWEHPMDDYYRKMFHKLKQGKDISAGGFKENINPGGQKSVLPALIANASNKKQPKIKPMEGEKNKEERLNMLMRRCEFPVKLVSQQLSEDAERKNLQGETEKLIYRHKDRSTCVGCESSRDAEPKETVDVSKEVAGVVRPFVPVVPTHLLQVRDILRSVRDEANDPLALNRMSLALDRQVENPLLINSPKVPSKPEDMKELEQRRLKELQEHVPGCLFSGPPLTLIPPAAQARNPPSDVKEPTTCGKVSRSVR